MGSNKQEKRMDNSKRWYLVHKVSGKSRRGFTTRAFARAHKRSTERILDTYNGVFVR